MGVVAYVKPEARSPFCLSFVTVREPVGGRHASSWRRQRTIDIDGWTDEKLTVDDERHLIRLFPESILHGNSFNIAVFLCKGRVMISVTKQAAGQRLLSSIKEQHLTEVLGDFSLTIRNILFLTHSISLTRFQLYKQINILSASKGFWRR